MESQSVIVVEPSEVEVSSLGKASSAIALPVANAEPEIDRTPGSAEKEESGNWSCFMYICFAPFIILSSPIYVVEKYCCTNKEETR